MSTSLHFLFLLIVVVIAAIDWIIIAPPLVATLLLDTTMCECNFNERFHNVLFEMKVTKKASKDTLGFTPYLPARLLWATISATMDVDAAIIKGRRRYRQNLKCWVMMIDPKGLVHDPPEMRDCC